MKAITKYPGSKWSLADWIIGFFPEHHSYLEPFFGSGAVLFSKPRSNIETINDLDGEVVNLFACIRHDPERLARSIYMTPYARAEYERVFQEQPEEAFERARNFCIRLNMGHGFRTSGEKVGWKNDVQGRERSYALQDWCNLPDRIIQAAERLKDVQIDNSPAIDIISRFNFKNVLVYCDPPYMLNTRHGKQYKYEMDSEDHEALLDCLLKHRGYAIISGYDCELYNAMLKNWNKFEMDALTQKSTKRKEVVWLNYDPPGKQLTFEDVCRGNEKIGMPQMSEPPTA